MLQNKAFHLKITRLVLGAVFLGIGIFYNSMHGSQTPPIIKHIEWGKITVLHNDKEYKYRDAKLWPTKSKEWNWKETGTQHDPGIQVSDLKEFIDEVDVVILTRGMEFILKVPQDTIDYLKSRNLEYHVGQTEEMVKLYNKLVKDGRKVGGLFHSTC